MFSSMENTDILSVQKAAREWNRAHDGLRVLPVELRAMCWSFLPQADILLLASVCSSWRDASRRIPSLWTTLNISGGYRDLASILSRSGQLQLDLSVSVSCFDDLAYFDACLLEHAHRLRALRIVQAVDTYTQVDQTRTLFDYPAPVLADLSVGIKDDSGNFAVPADMFRGEAPSLRRVTLREVLLPASCPAFAAVTQLALQWRIGSRGSTGIENIFTVAPNVERLEADNMINLRTLPHVPQSHRLVHVALLSETLEFSNLLFRGYLDLPSLRVSAHFSSGIIISAVHYTSPGMETSLSVCRTGAVRVDLSGARGTAASFLTRLCSDGVIFDLFSEGRLPHIVRLAIPITIASTHPQQPGPPSYPYIRGELCLPALRTLVLYHGPTAVLSLLDSSVECGTIVAPQLARIELRRSETDWRLADAGAVDPGQLAAFIETHIQCDDAAALELFVNLQDGVVLAGGNDGGMEGLRRCVGKLLF